MKEEIYDIKLMLSQTNYETSFNANATCSHRLLNYITSIEEENQKLNNIINELEKWLKEKIDYRRKEMIEFEEDIQFSNYEEQQVNKEEMVIRNFEIIELQDTLDKLQELKEKK